MKKLLSIVLALAMILSTIIIPTAIAVGAEEVTVLTKEYFVSAGGNDETGDGSQENPFATINKAQAVAAALENETTVVNATINLLDDDLLFDGGVAHKGMFTIKGYEDKAFLNVESTWLHLPNSSNGSNYVVFKGPTTLQNVELPCNGVTSNKYFLTGGHKVVISNETTLEWKGYTYFVGPVDNVNASNRQEIVVNNLGGGYGTTNAIKFGSFFSATNATAEDVGGVDFEMNGGRLHSIEFLKNVNYSGDVNLVFNNMNVRGDQKVIYFTNNATFGGAFQFIVNNNKHGHFDDAQKAKIEAVTAAKGAWVMYGKSTNGTLTTTETAGTFKVNSTAIAQAENKATGEVYFAENGYLTVPAGVYEFSFGGPDVLYVSETGSDETGDGTEANPFATVDKATELMANNIKGTIYVSGNITTAVNPKAHVGMITIQGVKDTGATIGYGHLMNPNGPLTIKDVIVRQNGNHPLTNGHEFILDIKKGSETNTVAYNLGNKNNTATSFTNEKMTVIRNERGWLYGPTKFELGYGTYTGGIDLLIENSHTSWIRINNSIFKGDVNITIDAFTQRSDEGFYKEVFTEGATLEKALQVIYNNNSAANIKTTKVFETDAVTAAGGKWVIYGDATGGKLRITETAGTFKVVGTATAVATNAAGDEVLSENGILTLDAGIWNVTYEYRNIYVSETGSDETGDGSEEKPFKTVDKALATVSNAKGATIYVSGTVSLRFDTVRENMVTITGLNGTEDIVAAGWGNTANAGCANPFKGPITFKDVSIKGNGQYWVSNGKDVIFENTPVVAGTHTFIVGNAEATQADENVVVNGAGKGSLTQSFYFGTFGTATKTGAVNFVMNEGTFQQLNFKNGTFAGDVNIVINNHTPRPNDREWSLLASSDVKFEKALQVIFNNNSYSGVKEPKYNEWTSLAADGGMWFIKSATGDSLETTDVAGTYNVVGGMVATATNGTDTVKSVDGVLTIPAGTWDISYDMTDFYVSETGSDETGDGTKANPYNTVDKALASIGNKEGATIYVSGAVSLRFDTVRENMVTITGLNGTQDMVKAGWGNTANAGISNPFKGPITFKDISFGYNGQYWISDGNEVIFENVGGVNVTAATSSFYVGNATAGEKAENVVINGAGKGYQTLSYQFGTFGTATKTGAVNFVMNEGTFQQLNFKNGTFAGNVNIVINKHTPRPDDREWNLHASSDVKFEKALQVIFNNNSYSSVKEPKYNEWTSLTADGGMWFIKSAAGGSLATTDVAGKFAVTTTNNFVAIAYDESGKAVATSENGILDLSNAEGVYTVSYVDGSVLLDAIYVSATEGNDSNIGSEEYPVATLKAAIEKVKALTAEDKVIYIMGTVPTLVNGAADYVTYSEMITFKGYDENSALEFTTTWKNQVDNIYMFQGPTTLEDLRLISAKCIGTNGNEVVINDCYMNTTLTVFVGDHEKQEANAKINKLTVNGLEFFNETFTGEAPWLGLTMYYGAFGGDAKQVESGAAANFATAGVEVYINGTNLKAFRFDRSRGYISGDVKLTVDKAFIIPEKQGGYQTQIGSIKDGVLTQPNVIKGAYTVVVNNNVGDAIALGTYDTCVNNNLTFVNAELGEYFVYSADINGNKMAATDEAGKIDILSDYSVDVKDAEGNVVKRASDVLDVEEGIYYVGYYNAADINADGKLDIRDLVAFKNESANAEVKNYAQFDISLDGLVNAQDLASFQQYFLNVIDIKFAPVRDDLAFTYFEDVELASDEFADEYKTVIYAEDDSNVPDSALGGTYYVSTLNPNSTNKGTKENPFTSIEALNEAFANKSTILDYLDLQKVVLFERGSVFRTSESLILQSKTYYGAYGEGDKPQILGSLRDYADASLWTTENGGSIWQLQLPELADDEEGSNIVVTKNGVEGIAKRASSLAGVDTTGEYYYDKETNMIYLFCDFINPAKYFDSIEISTTNNLIRNFDPSTSNDDRVYNDNFTVENLCVKFSGIHTFALSDVNDSTIQFCEIGWAGGHHTAESGERYGNGIEFWNRAINVTVANNHIYQCYDAAVTYQGSSINQYENVVFEANLIERCSYGFELWAGSRIEPIEVPEVGSAVTQTLIDNIAAQKIEISTAIEVGDIVTAELVAEIEEANIALEETRLERLANVVMSEVQFINNVNRLAAGGMGGVCRPYSRYQSFIQPFSSDFTLYGEVDVTISGNIFDTSYRSFVWGTGGTTEEDYIGTTIPLLTFEGNIYWQNTSIAPTFAVINGAECESDSDFEDAVLTLDESAEYELY